MRWSLRLSRTGLAARPLGVAMTFIVGFLAGPVARVGAADDPARVVGYERCADCHDLQAEAWEQSGHALRSLATLSTNPLAERYASRLGISPAELVRDSVCIDCHGTRQRTDAGAEQVAHGVACESCHGAAGPGGGSDGWIDLHCGEDDLKLTNRQRADACRAAGMAGVEDLYELALRCYGCHTVSQEKVVRVGHPVGNFDFELTAWFLGEVRHNFAPYTLDDVNGQHNNEVSNVWLAKNPRRNALARRRLMYVVGQLADLEVSLRNRGRATRSGSFATAAAGRVSAAQARLHTIAQSVDCPELFDALAALRAVQPLLFLPPERQHRPRFKQAADEVARAAREFVAAHDGTRLEALDPLLPREAKGQAFHP